jgi:nucleoid-associated protein
MALSKLIVHELKKESGTTTVNLGTSNQLIPIDNQSESLLTALLKSYSGDKILYADFDRSPGKYFPTRFDTYKESSRTDLDFLNFTIDTLGNLVTFIQSKTLARGGYLVFAEYLHNGTPFVSIFLIRDTEGKLLKRVENSFEIKTIEYLDTNHLAMACRINEEKIDNNESNCLSFTRLRQQDVSDYFTNWISVAQLESSTEYTKALYNIINNIPLPINMETNQPFTIDEVRHMVYDNARSNTQQNINIQALSEQIYGTTTAISDYADANNISIDTEFRYDKNSLRKFIQLSVNRDGISLKFSRGDSGTKVRLSEENPNQIIIESANFANALKAEIGTDD